MPFVFESLTTLFGAAVMVLLAFPLFLYSWSFLAQGLTAVITQGVREGTTQED